MGVYNMQNNIHVGMFTTSNRSLFLTRLEEDGAWYFC